MRKCLLFTVAVLSAAPAPVPPKPVKPAVIVGEPITSRTVRYGEKDVVTLRTRERFETMIILPKEENILDVVTGDLDNWEHRKAVNFAFVKPRFPSLTTNLTLITAVGNVYSFILTEAGEQQPDLKVFVEPRSDSMLTNLRSKPVFVPAVDVEDFKAQADLARKRAEEIQLAADKRIAQVEKETRKKLLMEKAAAPKAMRHDYEWEPQPDFNVVAIWNDGVSTFIAANPIDVPSVYELKDGKPSLIEFTPHPTGRSSEILYIVEKVLDRFYLAVGKRKMHVTLRAK
jgi:type IV secretion system protein VirB9